MRFRVFGLLFVLAVLLSTVVSAQPAVASKPLMIDTSVAPAIPAFFPMGGGGGRARPWQKADQEPEKLIVQEDHPLKPAKFVWDPAKVEFYLVPTYQEGTQTIEGTDVLGRLLQWAKKNNRKIPNATVLDRLLEHPDQIPKELIGKEVFFWGTTYRLEFSGGQCVRYLTWTGDTTKSGGWGSRCQLISNEQSFNFRANMPAAVLKQ